jgi:hypothetical protein
MKTLRALLIILTLSAQVSFGTVTDNSCPDSTCVELAATNTEFKLNQLQAESDKVLAEVPSLQLLVVQKIQKDRMPLQQIQMESEQVVPGAFSSFSTYVQKKLENRLQDRNSNSIADIKF